MMNQSAWKRALVVVLVGGCLLWPLGSCSSSEPAQQQTQEQASEQAKALEDGTYDIDVETDSSMFRSESCLLVVDGDSYTAKLSLPGEGFSRLYFGKAEDAAKAPDEDVYDYYLNDEGKYTFDVPVEALDEELEIAAYGQRRDTWYDHTITFHAPTSEAE